MPNDVAIVGFDDWPVSSNSVPALTTIRQPVMETGSHAVKVLVDLITGKAKAPIVEILPVELVVRESCGATRTASELEEERMQGTGP